MMSLLQVTGELGIPGDTTALAPMDEQRKLEIGSPRLSVSLGPELCQLREPSFLPR